MSSVESQYSQFLLCVALSSSTSFTDAVVDSFFLPVNVLSNTISISGIGRVRVLLRLD